MAKASNFRVNKVLNPIFRNDAANNDLRGRVKRFRHGQSSGADTPGRAGTSVHHESPPIRMYFDDEDDPAQDRDARRVVWLKAANAGKAEGSEMRVATILALTGLIVTGTKVHAEEPGAGGGTFAFAVVADAPYPDADAPAFARLIEAVNADAEIAFVIHGGDIKSGGSKCTNERLAARFTLYQRFRRGFVFTPGDNDWTDCHRESNGRYNPLERLAFLRGLFYPAPGWTTGGDPFEVLSQGHEEGHESFVENVLFERSGVIFSTIHVVGSNNGLVPWSGIDPHDSFAEPRPDRVAEFHRREAASIAWLSKTFEKARGAPGIFIVIHANPRFEMSPDQEARAGFNAFLLALSDEIENFGGPVVLAHGDFHVFFIDRPKIVPPFARGRIHNEDDLHRFGPNLIRFQTFGETSGNWVKVTVDPTTTKVFRIEPKTVHATRFR